MFSYFFAKGYLRQEENMLVSIPRDVVLKMDPEMQKLIGYEASGMFLPKASSLTTLIHHIQDLTVDS